MSTPATSPFFSPWSIHRTSQPPMMAGQRSNSESVAVKSSASSLAAREADKSAAPFSNPSSFDPSAMTSKPETVTPPAVSGSHCHGCAAAHAEALPKTMRPS